MAGEKDKFIKAVRTSKSYLYKWSEPCGDEYDSGAENPLDKLIALCRRSLELKHPPEEALAPAYLLNQELGLICTAIPHIDKLLSNPELITELSKSIKESSDLFSESSNAFAVDSENSSDVSPSECQKIQKEGWEAIRQIYTFMMVIQNSTKKGTTK